MRFFLFFLSFLIFGGVQAQEKCLDLFEIRYFEKSFENDNAKRLMDMFDRLNTAEPSLRPTIEQRIIQIYQNWVNQSRIGWRDGFPVRPLIMLPKYFAENLWKPTLENAVSGKTTAPYLTQAERDKLEVQMTRHGLEFVFSGEPVFGVLKGDFVVTMDRKIYIHHNQSEKPWAPFYKHSSIVLSAPVLFAGEISVNSQGQILRINNQSGHYLPKKKHLRWVKEFLTEMGFQLPEPLPSKAEAD